MTGKRPASPPSFFVLTGPDCAKILKRNHVGRLAFRNGRVVDIEPLGYVWSAPWLFMRSAYGAKLEALAHDPFVAFEVDEIDGMFDWRSVVVHGTIYMLPADGAPVERGQLERAMKALRRAMPGTLTPNDPVPERQVVYGLHADRVDGRMARSAKPGREKRRLAKARPAPKRRTSDGS
jgi:nitroimidazol reductase NimA-like FMN-containing flavoprotein (pyridoxamine 5'-phosphate oxidase superfamily)